MTQDVPIIFLDAIAPWPQTAQSRFRAVRELILGATSDIPNLTLLETLKWKEPSWLPDRPRIGSTLRVSWHPSHPNDLGLYVNCKTTLANTMRDIYPDAFTYDGTRALRFALDGPMPEQAVAHCAVMTLTYHRKTA